MIAEKLQLWIKVVIFLLTIFLLPGCAHYSQKYIVIKPSVQGTTITPVERKVLPEFGIIRLDFSGLRFSVRPFNGRLLSDNSWVLFFPIPDRFVGNAGRFGFGKKAVSADSPFIVEVTFYSVESELSFDPPKTILHLSDQDYNPAQMVIPPDLSFIREPWATGLSTCSLRYGLRLEERLKPLEEIHLSQRDSICIWLNFDVAPPTPETEYSISLDGIEMGGKPIQIPTLHFVKGETYQYDKIP